MAMQVTDVDLRRLANADTRLLHATYHLGDDDIARGLRAARQRFPAGAYDIVPFHRLPVAGGKPDLTIIGWYIYETPPDPACCI